MIWLALIAIAATAAYIYLNNKRNYWRRLGVPQTDPYLLVGDLLKFFLKGESLIEFSMRLYDHKATSRYTGFYQFVFPSLVVRDADLMKQIMIKDFDHFTDHQSLTNPDSDPIFGGGIFQLKGQKWRDTRAVLSPAFTSSKMRMLFKLIKETADNFIDYFKEQETETSDVNMKETLTRFTNDVIATTAFGVKVNSLADKNNDFYLKGKEATDLSGVVFNLKMVTSFLLPKVYVFLGWTLLPKVVNNYFIRMIFDTLKVRREKNIVRPDVIHLMMEAQKGRLNHDDEKDVETSFAIVQESSSIKKTNVKNPITDLDIAAQAVGFFFAGFDTVSSLMCFLAYELAANPDIQAKLREEINEFYEESNGNLTYEQILQMKYLDMVVTETLRKWPVNVTTERVCTKPYVIEPVTPDEVPVPINVGQSILISMYAFHHDPKYFPDPEKFDPERFSDENKSKPEIYMPFGMGPRACIGSRFALLETKTLFFNILRNYEITFSPKMLLPLQLDNNALNIGVKGGFWFNFKRLE